MQRRVIVLISQVLDADAGVCGGDEGDAAAVDDARAHQLGNAGALQVLQTPICSDLSGKLQRCVRLRVQACRLDDCRAAVCCAARHVSQVAAADQIVESDRLSADGRQQHGDRQLVRPDAAVMRGAVPQALCGRQQQVDVVPLWQPQVQCCCEDLVLCRCRVRVHARDDATGTKFCPQSMWRGAPGGAQEEAEAKCAAVRHPLVMNLPQTLQRRPLVAAGSVRTST